MPNNIFQQSLTPVKPKVLESERIYVYVPTATIDTKGIASYNERDFRLNAGRVSLTWPMEMDVEQLANPLTNVSRIKVLDDEFENTNNESSITNPLTQVTYSSQTAEVQLNRKNRKAFERPDLVMLTEGDFEATTDEATSYVKYTLKKNDPFEKPSLVQLNRVDFSRENGIVEINWPYAYDGGNANTDGYGLIKIADNKIGGLYFNDNNELQLDFAAKLGDENNNFVTKGATATGSNAVVIGNNATGANNSIAIGAGAVSNTEQSVQLGQGTNGAAGTLQFRNYNLVNRDGKVYTNEGDEFGINMVQVASKNYVRDVFQQFQNIRFEIVETLPTENIELNVIYLIEIPNDDPNIDSYAEFVYINGEWERLGTTGLSIDQLYTREQTDELLLDNRKVIILGADGVIEENVCNFTVENPDAYTAYKTNGTKFLVDLHLPISGDLDKNLMVAITFGDTVYYVHNILKGNERITIGDLQQVDKYDTTGYRFIVEMLFFETGELTGFAIIPTVSMSDILSLDSDQMDNYIADGGLTNGQLAVCNKVITNGYDVGALYRFDITYPDTYSWTRISSAEIKIDNDSITQNSAEEIQAVKLKNAFTNVDTTVTKSDFSGATKLSKEQYYELLQYGQIEVDGQVITYSDGEFYITPDLSEDFDDRISDLETTVTELTPEVAKSLKTPMTAPISTELVAVDTANGQAMIKVGEGLVIEDDTLKATGGGGGGTVSGTLKSELFTGNLVDFRNFINSKNVYSITLGAGFTPITVNYITVSIKADGTISTTTTGNYSIVEGTKFYRSGENTFTRSTGYQQEIYNASSDVIYPTGMTTIAGKIFITSLDDNNIGGLFQEGEPYIFEYFE